METIVRDKGINTFKHFMRRDLAAIRTLKIQTASGGTVPLASVANIDYSEGVSSIKRNNRYRVVSIGSDLPQGVALDTASARFREIVNGANIPASVRLAESGDTKVQTEMQQSFVNAMALTPLPGFSARCHLPQPPMVPPWRRPSACRDIGRSCQRHPWARTA